MAGYRHSLDLVSSSRAPADVGTDGSVPTGMAEAALNETRSDPSYIDLRSSRRA